MAVKTSADSMSAGGVGVPADRRGLGAVLCAVSALTTMAAVALIGAYVFTGPVDNDVVAEDAEQLQNFAPAAGPASND